MSDERADDAITIAVRIGDPLLADRIVAALGNVTGIHLVPQDGLADVVIVAPDDAPVAPIEHRAHAAMADDAGVSPSTGAALTPREREVLTLLAEGASNKTIASRLGISVHTAKFHVGSLLDKLDASGRTDAVTHAARLGVIDL